MNSIEHRGRTQCALIGAALLLGVPSLASARTELLRWMHDAPASVAGFKVHWGDASRAYQTTIDVGKPATDSSGIFQYGLSVPDTATVYVALTAYDTAGLQSGYSNEQQRIPGAGSAGTGSTGSGDTGSTEPPPNAVWLEDFGSSAIGSQIANWVDTQSMNSLVEDDSLFAAADLMGDRVLTTSSTATAIHSHLITTESSSWTTYEVRARIRVTSVDSRIGVASTSRFVNEAALYRLSSHWTSGELELHGLPWDATSKSCTSKGTGLIPQPNTWYHVRFQVIPQADHNLLRAKAWQDGGAEPAAWQAECSDFAANRPTAGTIGVWSSRGGTKYWDDFQVIQLASDGTPIGTGAPGGTGSTGTSATGGTGTLGSLGAPGQPVLVP